MPLSGGSRLGPYEILAPLGAGGMGEVYRARDTRLDREIAIKVLPERLAADPVALSRFEREAKAVAALSHPNILAIHDFNRHGDTSYVVLELLEGESMSERLLRGPIPWRHAAEIAIAIADGLSAAHAKGIVHRDLKPQNLFLTREDRVKILDFGLARREQTSSGESVTQAMTEEGTSPGTILGTIGYMSPEQVLGDPADWRTDLFSLGCVLHEMLTGNRAFRRRTPAETMAAILNEEPPALTDVGAESGPPPGLSTIIGRCLEKNPELRFQSARDFEFALKEVLRGATIAPPASSGSHRRPIESMAVLPFANAGGDPDAEYLSDGIAESIIHSLSKLPGLRVMARSTISRYKGRDADPQHVGRELGVRAVLTGRVFHRGETLIVKTELVDGRDGSQLWGENYSRKLSDILAIEEEISREISETLRLKLSSEEEHRRSKRETESTEAHRLFLKGRFFWNKRSPDALRKGIECFRLAIEEDPEYALAYAGMADCYNNLGFYNYEAPAESFPKAKAAARRALELDGDLAVARTALGYALLYYDWDWDGAEREFRRAIELDPNYPTAHQYLANALLPPRRFDEAIAELRLALDLDPLSLIISASLGYGNHMAGRYDEAQSQLQKTLEMDPGFLPAHLFLGYVYLQTGEHSKAVEEFSDLLRRTEGNPLVNAELGCAYVTSGRRSEAETILTVLRETKERFVSPYSFALLHTALGEHDAAFDALEKAVAIRAHEVAFLPWEPQFDPLRGDPRFKDLLRRVGL